MGGGSPKSSQRTEQYDNRSYTENNQVYTVDSEVALKAVDESFALGDAALGNNLSLMQGVAGIWETSFDRLMDVVEENQQTESQSITQNLIKMAMPIAFVAVIFWGMSKL